MSFQEQHAHRKVVHVNRHGKTLRGKAAPPYIDEGVIISRFKFEKMIGGGGFGQIYRAVNIDEDCAVLRAMLGEKHFPKLVRVSRWVGRVRALQYCSGDYGNYNYIIMEMLGRNLTDIRKRHRKQRLSVANTFKIAFQLTEAFETLHSKGYLHRDVKPANMCIGTGTQADCAYLIDFGMARKFRAVDGSLRPARDYASFRGTTRYASPNVHERLEQTAADDFMSLFYTLIELCEGSLPWRLLENADDIHEAKLRNGFSKLINYTPRKVQLFYDHITSLKIGEMPDYKMIKRVFKSCLPEDVSEHDGFDWNTD